MEIPAAEVHVWALDLARPKHELDALASLLSEDELLRAANMRVETSRRHFVVARGALRVLLAAYLGTVEPADLSFALGRHGKPELEGRPLRFNVSHSGELGLIAVTRERALGVDLQLMRRRGDPLRVAQRYFAPAEIDAIEEAPDRSAWFYLTWVAKEAFVKATGLGVVGELRSFEVRLEPRPRIAHVGGDRTEAQRWSLALLDVARGYAGALVTEGDLERLPLRSFDPLRPA